MDLVAEIAARYGVSVAPGVTVQRLPVGASSRPYPVWNAAKNRLDVPDWQDQRKALQSSGVRRARAARQAEQAKDALALQKLLDMHAAGATTAAIAAACGISQSYARAILSRHGLVANRDPQHAAQSLLRLQAPDAQARRATAQKARIARRDAQIRALAAEGADLAAIAQATGLKNGQHLRRLVAKLAPDHAARFSWPVKHAPAPRLRGPSRAEVKAERIRALIAEGAGFERIAADLGMKPGRHLRRIVRKVAPDFGCGPQPGTDLSERDRMVARLYPTLSKPQMAARLGLTVSQITAAIKRARASGLLPTTAEAAPPKREKRRPKGLVYCADRKAQILDLHRQGLTIEAIMAATGLKRDPVARTLWAAGESVRNERSTVAARRISELPGLIAQGLDGAAIAARWGVTLGTVYQIAHRAGVSLTGRKDPHNRGAVSPNVAARRELVRHLVLKGTRQVEMMDLLKISHATLSSDIKALGLSGQSLNTPARRKAAREAGAERPAA